MIFVTTPFPGVPSFKIPVKGNHHSDSLLAYDFEQIVR